MSGRNSGWPQAVSGFVFAFLSKFRVLHQILIVISVMAFFLVLEGYLSLRIIDNLQESSKKLFRESTQHLTLIITAKREVEMLRKEYITNLVNLSPITPTALSLSASLDGLQVADADMEGLGAYVENIEYILAQAINSDNFDKLDQQLTLLETELQQFHNRLMSQAITSMDQSNRYSESARSASLWILLVSLVVSLGLGVLIAASISRPLRKIAAAANALAVGDLSKNVKAEGCYEVTEVMRGLNHAIEGLRQLVRGINEHAKVLIEASIDLERASTESGRSAAEVSRAMEELTQASSAQADQITEAVNTVNRLSQLVQRVTSDTERIASVSEKVVDSAMAGQNVTGKVAREIGELYTSTKEVAAVIEELNKASEEITEITSLIEGIAEQTTLLALNASIEAARAGVHGKGFGVVAKETAKLAEQSKQAAQMITGVISQMKSRTDQAVLAIQNGMRRVEAGRDLTMEAAVTFKNIFQVLEEALAQINQVAGFAREMAEKNGTVITVMANISAVSEESMAGTEEVTATAEEQTAEAEEVMALAQNLAGVANGLKGSVAVFELGGEAGR